MLQRDYRKASGRHIMTVFKIKSAFSEDILLKTISISKCYEVKIISLLLLQRHISPIHWNLQMHGSLMKVRGSKSSTTLYNKNW